MNEEYNKVNVKLLSILAYIGPLFLMGKLSVEKDEPHVKFHTHQGAILFCFVAGAYVVTSLLCWNYRSLGDYDRYGRDRGGEKPTAAASLCRRF